MKHRPIAADRNFIAALQALPAGEHTIIVQPLGRPMLKIEGSMNYNPPGDPSVWLTINRIRQKEQN